MFICNSTMVIASISDGNYTENDPKIPLKNVSVVGDILDCFGTVIVTQTYENSYDRPIEAHYTFKLTDGSIVSGFKMTIGSHSMIGVVKPANDGHDEYSTAKRDGKHAALLTQHDNLYRVILGNILPDEQITVEITYLTKLPVNANGFKFVLPTNIAPIYVPPDDVSKYGLFVMSTFLHTTHTAYDFNVHLTWRTGSKFLEITSPTNHISFVTNSDKHVCFTVSTAPSRGDFVVYAKTDARTLLYDYCDTANDNDHYILMAHQIADVEADTSPKSYQFILDQSGSMTPSKIANALEALTLFVLSLSDDSFFNIISFGSSYIAQWAHSVPVTNENVEIFKANIHNFKTDMGGTNIYNCLNDVLLDNLAPFRINTEPVPAEKDIEKVFILLTDGQVSNVDHLVGMLKSHSVHQKCRVFGVGIGSDASRDLIEKMSYETGGTCRMVIDDTDISDNVIYLLSCVSKQTFQHPTLEIGTYRTTQRSIYPNHYFSSCCKLNSDQYASFLSTGATLSYYTPDGDASIVETFPATSAQPAPQIIKMLWVHSKMDELSRQSTYSNRDALVELSLKHQLMNPHTSFVIVSENVVTNEFSIPRLVPQYAPGYFNSAAPASAGFGMAVPASAGFGMAAPASAGFPSRCFSFAAPASGGFTPKGFGTAAPVPASASFGMAAPASAGFTSRGFGTPTTTFVTAPAVTPGFSGFAPPTTTTATPRFSFGAPAPVTATSATPRFSFGAPAPVTATTATPRFSFGAPAPVTAPTFSFANPIPTTAPTFSFANPVSATAPIFKFGTQLSAPASEVSSGMSDDARAPLSPKFVFDPTKILEHKDVTGSFNLTRSSAIIIGYASNIGLSVAATAMKITPHLYFNLVIYNEFKKLGDSKYTIILNNLKKWLSAYLDVDEMIKLL